MQNQDNIDNIYTIINRINQGGFSFIYLVRNENNHNQYVAKVRINENQQLFNTELQMTKIVSGLNKPNLIHLIGNGNGPITFGGNVENNRNYLILDYHQKGNLFNYTQIPNQGFREKHAKFIYYKILIAVKALHANGICHRNLKLEDILLDQNFNPIISDFCLATNNHVYALNEFVGTQGYMSPQVINNDVYDGFKEDVFSLGAALFILVTGRRGFISATIHDNLYSFIANRNFDGYWNAIQNNGINLSKLFKALYIKMVDTNEINRPTIEEVLHDNWFNEINNLNNEQQAQLEAEVRNDFVEREIQINQHNNQQNQQNQNLNNP